MEHIDAFLLLIKDNVTSRRQGKGLISVPIASDMPLHSLRSPQGFISPRSDADSTPINHAAKVSVHYLSH